MAAATAGTAATGQIVHGQAPAAAVAKVQVASAASALPTRSLTPLAPPFTVAA